MPPCRLAIRRSFSHRHTSSFSNRSARPDTPDAARICPNIGNPQPRYENFKAYTTHLHGAVTLKTLYTLRTSSPSKREPWRQLVRNYSTALEDAQRGDPPPAELDLSKATADSSYLDFILGPKDGGPPTDQISGDQDSQEIREGQPATRKTSGKPWQSRSTRLAQSNATSAQRRRTSVPPDSLESPAGREEARLEVNNVIESPDTIPESKSPTASIQLIPMLQRDPREARHRHLRGKFEYYHPIKAHAMLSTTWKLGFEPLRRYYDKRTPAYLVPRIDAKLHAHAAQWARATIAAPEGEIHTVWKRLAMGQRSRRSLRVGLKMRFLYIWLQVGLWLMQNQPEQMVRFLRETRAAPFPPARWVGDSLKFLVSHFSHERNDDQLGLLADLVPLLVDRESVRLMLLRTSTVAILIPLCNYGQLNTLYSAVKSEEYPYGRHTLLHFCTEFARRGFFEQGLEALLEAARANADLGSYAFRSNCATLLRKSLRQPGGLRVCLRIVDNLVELGVPLNIVLYNIVMLNAVEAGDLNTAFSLYRSLVEQGLEADSYTYAILLKGCKYSIGDAELLNTTIRDAIKNIDVLKSPIVALEILHCLMLHHKMQNPEKVFDFMSSAFLQLFDPTPLQRVGILWSIPSQEGSLTEKMQPSKTATTLMIGAFLEHSLAQTRSVLQVHEVYKRFLALANGGVEPFVSMAQEDYIWNFFLMAFIKSKPGLYHAANAIKDMQRSSAEIQRCKPTQMSWSIFLHGFTKHGETKLAEQVLKYMRGQGIEPDQITWNKVVAGYAGEQNVQKTLDTLREMEEQNMPWDRWTIAGLGRLRDRERLFSELEAGSRMPQLDFTSDIKEGLVRRVHEPLAMADSSLEGGAVHGSQALGDETAPETAYKPFD